MAVFRIERTRDYTVMSNHHLRNANLSLKAKGLLSMMLSLPEDWNYTTRGLAKICKEGVDAIGAALRELEAAGYIVRHKLRDSQGRISDTEYVIYEQPQLRKPDTDSPDTENPYMDKPDTEKPAELNIEKSNTQKQNIYGSSTDSIPFRDCAADCLPERKGRDAMSLTEIESYRELIQENIGYEYLCQQYETYREDLDEIVELIVETVCAKRKTTRIAGSDFPHEIVRSRFLKLDNSHIEFVMDCLQKNTTEIRNMKQYLLTVLFNAPTTISNHYTSQVNHDLYAEWCSDFILTTQSLHLTSKSRSVWRLVNGRFFIARNCREKGASMMSEGKTIGQLMEEMRAKAGAQNYHGHGYMDLQRFAEDTRHMIIFDVLTNDSPVGWKGERTRLFLSDTGYEKALDSQEKGQIKILSHAKVRQGNLHYDRSDQLR